MEYALDKVDPGYIHLLISGFVAIPGPLADEGDDDERPDAVLQHHSQPPAVETASDKEEDSHRDDPTDNIRICLRIPVPTLLTLCLLPIKFLRFLGYCILGVEGVIKLALHPPALPDDAPIAEGTIYHFRVPRGRFCLAHAVDLGLVHKDSSTSTDASCDDELCSALEQRDKFCIFTGRAPRRSVTAHIIPFAKAHWLSHILATRPHVNEDLSTLDSIDDVRNALFVERNTHAALGTSELAVLCTPNPILATTDIPPAAPRTLLDGTSYPSDARYTAQWLEPPSFGDLAQNTDAAFATEAPSETMPSQLLLTYRYGVAAVIAWAIGDAESLLATPSCEERARLGLPPRPSPEPLGARDPTRRRKRKRDDGLERREEAHDLVLSLWLGHSDVQRKLMQEKKDFSDRVQEWRKQVPSGAT